MHRGADWEGRGGGVGGQRLVGGQQQVAGEEVAAKVVGVKSGGGVSSNSRNRPSHHKYKSPKQF